MLKRRVLSPIPRHNSKRTGFHKFIYIYSPVLRKISVGSLMFNPPVAVPTFSYALSVLLVRAAVRYGVLINPVFLRVSHAATARNRTHWPRPIEWAGSWAVAECFSSVAALARIPLIDDHLDRHLTTPDAGRALLLVGFCSESPMTALAIDRKRRWNNSPRWRRRLLDKLTYRRCQIGDLVELDRFKTQIVNHTQQRSDG